MELRNHGITGIYYQVALFPSLGCKSILWSEVFILNDDFRQGYPNIRTVDYWLGGDKSERFPQSRCIVYYIKCWVDPNHRNTGRICNNHNKADGFERRLEVCSFQKFEATILTPPRSCTWWKISSMLLIWKGDLRAFSQSDFHWIIVH